MGKLDYKVSAKLTWVVTDYYIKKADQSRAVEDSQELEMVKYNFLFQLFDWKQLWIMNLRNANSDHSHETTSVFIQIVVALTVESLTPCPFKPILPFKNCP